MGVRGVHHIGIAVKSLDEALKLFSGVLGLEHEHTVVVKEHCMRAAWLRAGTVKLELMEPLGPEGPVASFLSKRGEGVHHVALLVDDIEEAMEVLRRAGAVLVYDEPRVAHDGSRYNFVHPKSAHGVLIELREEKDSG